jgi:hypothetical protein
MAPAAPAPDDDWQPDYAELRLMGHILQKGVRGLGGGLLGGVGVLWPWGVGVAKHVAPSQECWTNRVAPTQPNMWQRKPHAAARDGRATHAHARASPASTPRASAGFQAGSLIGLAGVVPVLALRRGGVTAELVTAGSGYGALGGMALSRESHGSGWGVGAGRRCPVRGSHQPTCLPAGRSRGWGRGAAAVGRRGGAEGPGAASDVMHAHATPALAHTPGACTRARRDARRCTQRRTAVRAHAYIDARTAGRALAADKCTRTPPPNPPFS